MKSSIWYCIELHSESGIEKYKYPEKWMLDTMVDTLAKREDILAAESWAEEFDIEISASEYEEINSEKFSFL